MQKGGGWVQIACKIAYVLNGRSLMEFGTHDPEIWQQTLLAMFKFLDSPGDMNERHLICHPPATCQFYYVAGDT